MCYPHEPRSWLAVSWTCTTRVSLVLFILSAIFVLFLYLPKVFFCFFFIILIFYVSFYYYLFFVIFFYCFFVVSGHRTRLKALSFPAITDAEMVRQLSEYAFKPDSGIILFILFFILFFFLLLFFFYCFFFIVFDYFYYFSFVFYFEWIFIQLNT